MGEFKSLISIQAISLNREMFVQLLTHVYKNIFLSVKFESDTTLNLIKHAFKRINKMPKTSMKRVSSNGKMAKLKTFILVRRQ